MEFHGAVFVGAVLVATLAAALYLPSLSNPLIWDDVVHAEWMEDGSAASAFTRVDGRYRRPVVLLSYLVQNAAGCGDASCLHAGNVLLHATNAVLLLLLLLRFGVTLGPAVAGTALFAAHPLQSAAVAYVSGRTDLLAALFTLVAVHVTLGGAGRERDGNVVPVIVRATAGALAGLAAAGSKEIGVMAGPISLAAWHAYPRVTGGAVGQGARSSVIPAAAVSLASALALPFVVPDAALATTMVALPTRLAAAGTAIATYLRLLVVPTDLHLDRLSANGGSAAVAAGVVFLVVTVLVPVAYLRGRSLVSFAVLAALLAYLPASNLVPVYPAIADRWVFTPEQFMYLPLAALAPLVAGGAHAGLVALASRRRLEGGTARAGARGLATTAVAVATSMLVALSVAPIRARQARMADEEAVYSRTLELSPSPRACFNLGVTLIGRGDYAEAATVYERCATISPGDASVYVQLGVAYQKLGQPRRAEIAYASALQKDARNALAWSNYASLRASEGQYDEARRMWEKALEIAPGFAPARSGLERLSRVREGTGR